MIMNERHPRPDGCLSGLSETMLQLAYSHPGSWNLFCRCGCPPSSRHLDTRKPVHLKQMYKNLSSKADLQY